MANQRHLDILRQGVEAWNRWCRERDLSIMPDLINAHLRGADLSGAYLINAHLGGADLSGAYLINAHLKGADLSGAHLNGTDLSGAYLINAHLSGADLSGAHLNGADLSGADLSGADLSGADLSGADLKKADLRGADLRGADLKRADLKKADLSEAKLSEAKLKWADLKKVDLSGAYLMKADLSEANLSGAYLTRADLTRADLTRADLTRADLDGTICRSATLIGATLIRTTFIHTDLAKADLTQCKIFGSSVWDVHLESTLQKDLVITDHEEPKITVDNIEVAQFIYLLLNNQKMRDVINTITSKVVLVLGRFTDERKLVLDALRDELRNHNYLPVVFDFEKPSTRDLTETVNILAHLARFIILDLTDPSSAPHEAATIIPHCVVPVQPLLLQNGSEFEYTLFQDLQRRYHWVLPTYRYKDTPGLLESLKEHIIDPAEKKAQELEK